MGPEISIEPTPVTTRNTMASKNGMSWLTPRVGLLWARSIVVGIVMVVMEGVSVVMNLSKPRLPPALRRRFDVSQTLRYRRIRRGSLRNCGQLSPFPAVTG
jgi:hypothetical protein